MAPAGKNTATLKWPIFQRKPLRPRPCRASPCPVTLARRRPQPPTCPSSRCRIPCGLRPGRPARCGRACHRRSAGGSAAAVVELWRGKFQFFRLVPRHRDAYPRVARALTKRLRCSGTRGPVPDTRQSPLHMSTHGQRDRRSDSRNAANNMHRNERPTAPVSSQHASWTQELLHASSRDGAPLRSVDPLASCLSCALWPDTSAGSCSVRGRAQRRSRRRCGSRSWPWH